MSLQWFETRKVDGGIGYKDREGGAYAYCHYSRMTKEDGKERRWSVFLGGPMERLSGELDMV